MDNRKLSIKELKVLRVKAVEAVIKHGLAQNQVAIVFGFSETSISKYVREYKENKEKK